MDIGSTVKAGGRERDAGRVSFTGQFAKRQALRAEMNVTVGESNLGGADAPQLAGQLLVGPQRYTAVPALSVSFYSDVGSYFNYANRSLAGAPYSSDALIFTGTAAELVDLLLDWQDAGLSGFRLRPAGLPHDLTAIVEHVVPELQRRGRFRRDYEADTLRGLLGLPRPANRYTTA